MKHFTIILVLLFIAFVKSFGQFPDLSDPRYNPTVPNLLRLQHKAVSHKASPMITTLDDFRNTSNIENLNIYVIYEMDSKVGKSTGNADLYKVPKKLMDMYLIFDYRYRIFYTTIGGISDELPKIKITSNEKVNEIHGEYLFVKAGEVKEKKLNKSTINYVLIDSTLLINLNESNLIDSSYVDIKVQIKSRVFLRINPTISHSSGFLKTLTLSYPMVFSYKTPFCSGLEQSYDTISTFNLLHFHRNPGAGNGKISFVDVGSRIQTWKIIDKLGQNCEKIEFTLDNLNIPPNFDIGIDPIDLVKFDE